METPKARIIVVEQCYHQEFGSEPVEVANTFERTLWTDEQPYSRSFRVGSEWQKLDCGWVERAGLLHVVNAEAMQQQTQPSDDETREHEAKVIELASGESSPWLIRPGESFRGCPADISTLRVRCQSGEVKCTVTVYPHG